jgi:hypothetical protein
MFNAAHRRCTGPAIIAADKHHVGMGLGYTGSNSPHAYLGDQFDINSRFLVGVFQVKYKFGQVFN